MTRQTKTFIELSDMLAFKIECPDCHCSTVIPVDGFHSIPMMCPNGCTREWEQLHSHGVTEAFNEWIVAMRLVRDRTSQLGLKLSLEIREETKPTSAIERPLA